MAAYELKYTAEEIDGILESVDEKTIYDDATQSKHGLMSATDKAKLDSLPTSQQIESSLSGKVDKVDGKGLSENDYDDTAKAKVDAIPANPKYTDTTYDAGDGISIEGNVISATGGGGGGEENVIEAITMNGASVPVTNKTAAITETDPTVPSWAKQQNKPSYQYSEIGNTPDLSGFITKSVNDLANYYLKSETYTKAEVQTLIDAIKQFTYESVASLPTASSNTMHKIYLVPSSDPQNSNVKDEYITIESSGSYSWEQIGSTAIDLSGYVTTSALNTALASYATTQDLEDSKVFWAEVEVTTFAEIQDAIDAGRTVMLKDEDGYTYVLSYINDAYAVFSCPSGDEGFIKSYDVSDDSWEFYLVDQIESKRNKTTSISSSSKTTQYPTAKAVWDIVSTKYTKPQGGIPASDLASGVIPTVPVKDVTVGGTSVVNNGTAVIPAIPDVRGKEDTSNKVSTIAGNETNETRYPNTKAVADALGKWGVISQTQTWSGTGSQPRTYVMSDLVRGLIPQANIDLFESAGATFNATTGYFELNGLTDISYEEMSNIYYQTIVPANSVNTRAMQLNNCNCRCTLYLRSLTSFASSFSYMCFSNQYIERVNLGNTYISVKASFDGAFSGAIKLKYIGNGYINNTASTIDSNAFKDCYSLETLFLKGIKVGINFRWSPNLSKESILYLINNEAATSSIAITLHQTAYNMATNDIDIQTALQSHTNISLAQAS